MQFSWVTALVKGLRDALISAVPTAGTAIVLAVAGVVSADNLTTYGVPIYLIPILIAVFTAGRNVLRNKFNWPVVIAMLALFGASGKANAQTFDLTNVHFGAGASYLLGEQVEGTKKVNVFLSATVPGLKIGKYPCYAGGVGMTGGGLDSSLEQVEFGVAIPVLTCDLKDQFGVQVGYARLLTGPEEKPDGVYFNLTFALDSQKDIEVKREAKRAKKAKQKTTENPPAPIKTVVLQ